MLHMLVLDISDVFHQVPHKSCGAPLSRGARRGRPTVHRCMVFHSRSSPGVWGRVAALLGRSVMLLVDPKEFRLEVYVDDPWMAARGASQ